MMLRAFLSLCFATATCLVQAQGVIVNPDGTHSIVQGTADPNAAKVIIHPNGTHSILLPGTNPVLINPDGTHAILIGFDKPNSTGIIVHAGGKHTVVHKGAGRGLLIGSDGTHTVSTNSLWPFLQPNANSLVQVASLHCKVAMFWMAGLIW